MIPPLLAYPLLSWVVRGLFQKRVLDRKNRKIENRKILFFKRSKWSPRVKCWRPAEGILIFWRRECLFTEVKKEKERKRDNKRGREKEEPPLSPFFLFSFFTSPNRLSRQKRQNYFGPNLLYKSDLITLYDKRVRVTLLWIVVNRLCTAAPPWIFFHHLDCECIHSLSTCM